MISLTEIMRLIVGIPFVFLCFYVGSKGFDRQKNIMRGKEDNPSRAILRVALNYGVSSSLLLFSFIWIVDIFDKSNDWTFLVAIAGALPSFVLGVVVFLGTFYNLYTSTRTDLW